MNYRLNVKPKTVQFPDEMFVKVRKFSNFSKNSMQRAEIIKEKI
jgi:hypothetical protein